MVEAGLKLVIRVALAVRKLYLLRIEQNSYSVQRCKSPAGKTERSDAFDCPC